MTILYEMVCPKCNRMYGVTDEELPGPDALLACINDGLGNSHEPEPLIYTGGSHPDYSDEEPIPHD